MAYHWTSMAIIETLIFFIHYLWLVYIFKSFNTFYCYWYLFLGSTTNSVSQLVTNEVPLASLNIVPIDIDEIAPLPSRQSIVVSSTLDTSSIPSVTVTTPLSASRLRLLQDTTMIESALDLDSLEDASVGRGSQAGLIKMGAV